MGGEIESPWREKKPKGKKDAPQSRNDAPNFKNEAPEFGMRRVRLRKVCLSCGYADALQGIQGYTADKKMHPPRTLPWAYV